MKLHILSDLHLEFSEFQMLDLEADIRVLAGDIHTRERGIQWLMQQESKLPTVYVGGNHECYGTAVPRLYEKLHLLAEGTHIHYLENREVILGSTRFLGCTLWTDYGLLGDNVRETAMIVAKSEMNDFKKIRLSPAYRRLTPGLVYSFHRKSLTWLESRLREPFTGKTVVVSHHAPSPRSFPNDRRTVIDAAYASCLDSFIEQHPIDLWIHGHTHHCVDYHIGKTRVVSNSRGYPGDNSGFRADFMIDIR